VPSPELERNTLRYYWRNRAETTVEHWDLNLAVIVDETAVGMCSIEADDFPTRRSAETGSWVGRRYQRRGIGREVRHAALHLIFAGFDADQATIQPGTTTPLPWGSPARCPTSRQAPRSSNVASVPTQCWNSP
jgi:RimJ/RimL family protein N-acetyltransferase